MPFLGPRAVQAATVLPFPNSPGAASAPSAPSAPNGAVPKAASAYESPGAFWRAPKELGAAALESLGEF
eukprot:11211070-Alexandrium_andersonii.AAC.1